MTVSVARIAEKLDAEISKSSRIDTSTVKAPPHFAIRGVNGRGGGNVPKEIGSERCVLAVELRDDQARSALTLHLQLAGNFSERFGYGSPLGSELGQAVLDRHWSGVFNAGQQRTNAVSVAACYRLRGGLRVKLSLFYADSPVARH
ncbi:hypothetical protein [Ciceribacter selenitireducens]